MKLKRSSRCTLKFATEAKRQKLKTTLEEYGQVVNFFIDRFWENIPKKGELLKDIVNLPDTWLSARLRKVAAREAIDLIKSVKESGRTTKPIHSGKRMHVSSTIANLQIHRTAKTFDCWLHLASIGNNTILDLPIKGHKHINRLMALGKQLQSYIITEDQVQFCFQIETGPKAEQGEVVGIDTGINALATLDDGQQYGMQVKKQIERIKNKEHGSNKQKKARRALKQYMDETAKRVVSNKRLVVVEGLKKMNQKTKLTRRVSKNIRRSLGAWCYRYWLNRIQMACENNRVSFRTVNPAYTSQRCYACGHTESGNRNREIFKCKSCGYTCNADVNAAKNILFRFLSGPYGAAYKPPDLDKSLVFC